MTRAQHAQTFRAAVIGGAFALAAAVAALGTSGARGDQSPTPLPPPQPASSSSVMPAPGTPAPAASATDAGPQPIYPPSPCASDTPDCSPLPQGTYMSTQAPPPPAVLLLGTGHPHVTRSKRISATEFGVTITFTFTVGNNGYAWNHGYYAPEINNTWLGLVGPGVAHKGVDGSSAADGPSSAGGANATSARRNIFPEPIPS